MSPLEEDDNFIPIETKALEEFLLSIKPGGTPVEGDVMIPLDGKMLREFFFSLKPGKTPNTTNIPPDRLLALMTHILEQVEAGGKKKEEDAGRIAATGEVP